MIWSVASAWAPRAIFAPLYACLRSACLARLRCWKFDVRRSARPCASCASWCLTQALVSLPLNSAMVASPTALMPSRNRTFLIVSPRILRSSPKPRVVDKPKGVEGLGMWSLGGRLAVRCPPPKNREHHERHHDCGRRTVDPLLLHAPRQQ